MTHPDDEISIAAWIRRLTQMGVEVHLSWTHSTPTREREGRKAAEVLGVPDERLTFWDFPDGHVVDHLPAVREQMRVLMERVQPDRVCCGAFEQGHLDHDATNYAVRHAFDGPVFEIPFYHAYLSRVQRLNRFADPGPEEVLVLTREEQRFKKDFAKLYPSTNIWSCLFWYEAYQAVRLKPIELAKTERMRLKTDCEYRLPKHTGSLKARVETSARWHRWIEAVERDAQNLESPVRAEAKTSTLSY